ncbi:hypothetical protein Tco_0475189 [Tanacetum coccineum]
MGDEYLDTIPSVEELVPIPSKFEGISEDTCDVPVCEDPSTFDALNDHSEILSDPNDDGTSSDDDDFEDIEYVSLEEVNDVDQEEKEFDLEDILQIQDVILREKLLNINRLIANIESLNDNSTPNCVLKSTSPFPIPDSNSFFEKSDTSLSYSDNSLPEFESFSDHTEETSSGSTTTHANNSLPEYDSFHFEIEPDQGGLTSIVMEDILGEPRVHVPNVLPTHPTLLIDSDLIIRTFLPYFTYPVKMIENGAKTVFLNIVQVVNFHIRRKYVEEGHYVGLCFRRRQQTTPPMLEKHLYDLEEPNELYMLNRPHGRMILSSVEKGPLVWPSITEDGVTRLKEYIELTPVEAIQAGL